MDLLSEMGRHIFYRRKQLHLTQEELAELAGLTTQTVSTAELGKKALRPEHIIKLCGALEISTEYLLYGKINSQDMAGLSKKLSTLTPEQYHHLEDIINTYIVAVSRNKI